MIETVFNRRARWLCDDGSATGPRNGRLRRLIVRVRRSTTRESVRPWRDPLFDAPDRVEDDYFRFKSNAGTD